MIIKRLKFNSINNSTLLGAIVLCLSQEGSALEVAPYFQSWSSGTLTEAKKVTGLNSVTLAFAITKGTCALVPDLFNKLSDARNYVAAGGQLIISFGGQDGVYAEVACKDDDQLFTMLDKLMRDFRTRRIDWDIEGRQLLNLEGTARRTRILARLQAKYSDLHISFTLPGWLHGLSSDSIDLLTATTRAGVRIDRVNVMTMSFGLENLKTMVTPPTVAQASMMTFCATANQLKTIYPNKSSFQINAMMGITPMIGKNDDGATFTLDDARTITNFVRTNKIGFISYWSFQRDRAQTVSDISPIHSFSGVVQSDFQFHNIFKSSAAYADSPSSFHCDKLLGQAKE
jgi:hypothetical protein